MEYISTILHWITLGLVSVLFAFGVVMSLISWVFIASCLVSIVSCFLPEKYRYNGMSWDQNFSDGPANS